MKVGDSLYYPISLFADVKYDIAYDCLFVYLFKYSLHFITELLLHYY